jgi:hypothetical protein
MSQPSHGASHSALTPEVQEGTLRSTVFPRELEPPGSISKERDMESAQTFQREIETLKLSHDFMKHMATLSTGSIVLIVTFNEKLTNQPKANWLISVSIVALAGAIIGTLISQVGAMLVIQSMRERLIAKRVFLFCGISAALSFFVGICCVVAFGVVNGS